MITPYEVERRLSDWSAACKTRTSLYVCKTASERQRHCLDHESEYSCTAAMSGSDDDKKLRGVNKEEGESSLHEPCGMGHLSRWSEPMSRTAVYRRSAVR